MSFVKVQKTKAYFKRYQVKFARRRSGKTDYRARRRLVATDKNKYETPRYRLVVRLTAKYVICQIAYPTLEGDRILTSAYSSELPRYGIKAGLKNYAAAYATGLLVARRALTKLGLADKYKGNTDIDGTVVKTTYASEGGKEREYWVSEVVDGRKPFRCVLDVGIRNTTTGARVFGALKGASDGGLDIPHNEKRFPGYNRDAKEYKPEVHKSRIFGEHVADFMAELQEEDPELYVKRFSVFLKNNMTADNLVDVYTEAHARIRKDPSPAPKSAYKFDSKYTRPARKTLEERKAAVASKKLARLAALRAAAASAEDDE